MEIHQIIAKFAMNQILENLLIQQRIVYAKINIMMGALNYASLAIIHGQ